MFTGLEGNECVTGLLLPADRPAVWPTADAAAQASPAPAPALAPALQPPSRTFGLLRITAKLSPSDPFFFFFLAGLASSSMAQ